MKIFNRYNLKQSLCIILVFSLLGCKSSYRFKLHTQPSGALVRVGSIIEGETPCEIEIPANSVLIRDNYIDITYSLPDGRELTKTYDLSKYETPNILASTVGAIIAVPGMLLMMLTRTDKDDENSSSFKHNDEEEDDDEDEEEEKFFLIGLGIVFVGGLVSYVLGGNSAPLEGYDIFETFEDIPLTSTN